MFPGGKDGRCVGLTTLPPSCADCLEIWDPRPPGTLRPVQAYNGIALPLPLLSNFMFSLTVNIWTVYHMDGLLWTAGQLVSGWGSSGGDHVFNVTVTVVTSMQKTSFRISAVSMSCLTHFYGCVWHALNQCFSTAGPRPSTGPSHQLNRAVRGSPGICHFSFLSIFYE
jgi:hypothetical protein